MSDSLSLLLLQACAVCNLTFLFSCLLIALHGGLTKARFFAALGMALVVVGYVAVTTRTIPEFVRTHPRFKCPYKHVGECAVVRS